MWSLFYFSEFYAHLMTYRKLFAISQRFEKNVFIHIQSKVSERQFPEIDKSHCRQCYQLKVIERIYSIFKQITKVYHYLTNCRGRLIQTSCEHFAIFKMTNIPKQRANVKLCRPTGIIGLFNQHHNRKPVSHHP